MTPRRWDERPDVLVGRSDVELEDYLAIPYVLSLESAAGPDGSWIRCASYPELGLVGSASTPLVAIELLEQQRVRHIRRLLASGQDVPAPRRPLHNTNGWSELYSADQLEVAR